MLTFNTGNQPNANLPAAEFAPPGSLLEEHGVYLAPGRTSWQIGQLHLLPDRLLFVQPRGVLFDVPLAALLEVAVERKHYVVVRKPVMAVTYQDPRLRDPSTAFFLTPLLGQWVARLTAILGGDDPELPAPAPREPADFAAAPPLRSAEHGPALQLGALRSARDSTAFGESGHPAERAFANRTSGLQLGALKPPARPKPATEGRVLRPPQAHTHTGSQPPLSASALEKLARQLDPSSRAVLACLAERSHAPIRELSAAIGAAGDMAVLFCIRQNINPTAQALLGRPVLFFVETQLDQVTGEMVAYEWWLAGRRGRVPQARGAEYELHDEGTRMTVILEMVGADPQTVTCRLDGDRLAVRAEGARGTAQLWETDVPLPRRTTGQLTRRLNNGILSVEIQG